MKKSVLLSLVTLIMCSSAQAFTFLPSKVTSLRCDVAAGTFRARKFVDVYLTPATGILSTREAVQLVRASGLKAIAPAVENVSYSLNDEKLTIASVNTGTGVTVNVDFNTLKCEVAYFGVYSTLKGKVSSVNGCGVELFDQPNQAGCKY